MIKVSLCYNEKTLPLKIQLENFFSRYDIEFSSYNEDLFTERKKAKAVKSMFAARALPFCGIYKENKTLIKGFYSEAKECTISNIQKYITEYYGKYLREAQLEQEMSEDKVFNTNTYTMNKETLQELIEFQKIISKRLEKDIAATKEETYASLDGLNKDLLITQINCEQALFGAISIRLGLNINIVRKAEENSAKPSAEPEQSSEQEKEAVNEETTSETTANPEQ